MNSSRFKELLILSVLILWFSTVSYCQLRNFNTEQNLWYKGTFELEDGSEIEGDLNYNFITGILNHKYGNQSDPYTASMVSNFTLEDTVDFVVRKFYSIPYALFDPNRKIDVFFEVIHEKGQLAILSRHEFEYKEKFSLLQSGPSIDPITGRSTTFPAQRVNVEKVTEIIYLVSENGNGEISEYALKRKNIKRYPTSTFKNWSKKLKESNTKRKSGVKYIITDDKLVSEITSDHYPEIKKYCKSKKIKLNTIEGLVEVLDYYSTLN